MKGCLLRHVSTTWNNSPSSGKTVKKKTFPQIFSGTVLYPELPLLPTNLVACLRMSLRSSFVNGVGLPQTCFLREISAPDTIEQPAKSFMSTPGRSKISPLFFSSILYSYKDIGHFPDNNTCHSEKEGRIAGNPFLSNVATQATLWQPHYLSLRWLKRHTFQD